MIYCTSCRSENTNDARFCTNCGERMRRVSVMGRTDLVTSSLGEHGMDIFDLLVGGAIDRMAGRRDVLNAPVVPAKRYHVADVPVRETGIYGSGGDGVVSWEMRWRRRVSVENRNGRKVTNVSDVREFEATLDDKEEELWQRLLGRT